MKFFKIAFLISLLLGCAQTMGPHSEAQAQNSAIPLPPVSVETLSYSAETPEKRINELLKKKDPIPVIRTMKQESLHLIAEHLFNKKSLTIKEKVIFIASQLECDNDPFSRVSTLEESDQLEGKRGMISCGIGVVMMRNRKQDTFVIAYPNTPAALAGIQRYWMLKSIDKQLVAKKSLTEIGRLLEGRENSYVTFCFMHNGKKIQKKVQRQKNIVFPPLSVGIANGIGVIWIPDFNHPSLYSELLTISWMLQRKGVSKIVLDLRDNAGGKITNMLSCIGLFLSSGRHTIYHYTPKPLSKEVRDIMPPIHFSNKATGYNAFPQKIVVLINSKTGSSAEICALALRYYRKCDLVGENTYGKDSFQQYCKLGGHYVFATIGSWNGPEKTCVHNSGIRPTHKITCRRGDSQSQKAIDLLK